jgi:hypothetical protein
LTVTMGQKQIQHGGLVNDQGVGGDGVVTMALKLVATGVRLQQAVQGKGGLSGHLRQPLGGPTGGGGQGERFCPWPARGQPWCGW